VSDIPAETPRIARAFCPACEPDADTLLEILEVQWCNVHMPMREGLDDARVMSDAMLTGSAEAGGDENRRWCDIIHGDSHNGLGDSHNGHGDSHNGHRRAASAPQISGQG
jgi:hypothetical protein